MGRQDLLMDSQFSNQHKKQTPSNKHKLHRAINRQNKMSKYFNFFVLLFVLAISNKACNGFTTTFAAPKTQSRPSTKLAFVGAESAIDILTSSTSAAADNTALLSSAIHTVQDPTVETNVLNGMSLAIGELGGFVIPCQRMLKHMSIAARLCTVMADYVQATHHAHNAEDLAIHAILFGLAMKDVFLKKEQAPFE